ncbi:MAG: hypothetical protein ACLGGX_00090 [Bdellovibrionia bacterium]
MEIGQPQEAVQRLKPLAEKESGDQLVYLLDYATALAIKGDLEESNRNFIKADKLAENLDYLSISKFTGSLVITEELNHYRGDTFEKIFINAHLALNFLSLNNLDSALVEARRINEKLQKYRANAEKENFKKNEFGIYLSAIMWEANRSFDDAYIAYENTYKINPNYPGIAQDLIRSAKLSKRMDAYKKWKERFPSVVENPDWYDSKKASVVVLAMQGWGPRKKFYEGDYRYPDLKRVFSQTQYVQINWQDQFTTTNITYDVSNAAIETLNEDRGALIAKRISGYVAKEVLADQVRQKDENLGALVSLILNATDRADLRQWSTMPESIQVQRLYLNPGSYDFKLEGVNYYGGLTGEQKEIKGVALQERKTQFLVWRVLK